MSTDLAAQPLQRRLYQSLVRERYVIERFRISMMQLIRPDGPHNGSDKTERQISDTDARQQINCRVFGRSGAATKRDVCSTHRHQAHSAATDTHHRRVQLTLAA